jgi:NAD(P)-dependent dehydrogenase (short-subunit alcohol dehydrogenase family)
MARIFITGSADGLGQLAAKALIAEGHQVVLHARNETRGQHAMDQARGAEGVVIADLAISDDTKELASKVNALGTFDAIIHNAGVYQDSPQQIFAVNTLAPYILTCLIQRPKRLIYLSSGMHMQGHFRPEIFKGWVPTRMGGKGAPDDLQKGYETQVWLAISKDAQARVSGNYFHHKRVTHHNPEADDVRLQEKFLSLCEEVTGVSCP